VVEPRPNGSARELGTSASVGRGAMATVAAMGLASSHRGVVWSQVHGFSGCCSWVGSSTAMNLSLRPLEVSEIGAEIGAEIGVRIIEAVAVKPRVS
jgi:hypothetical protein